MNFYYYNKSYIIFDHSIEEIMLNESASQKVEEQKPYSQALHGWYLDLGSKRRNIPREPYRFLQKTMLLLPFSKGEQGNHIGEL